MDAIAADEGELLAQLVEQAQALVIALRRLQRVRAQAGEAPAPVPVSTERIGYRLFGQWFPCHSGVEVFTRVLSQFCELEPNFAPRFSEACKQRGNTRTYCARSPNAIYPGRPDLARRYIHEISTGWYVGTNESNATKRDLLKLACRTLELVYDKDLQIRLAGRTERVSPQVMHEPKAPNESSARRGRLGPHFRNHLMLL